MKQGHLSGSGFTLSELLIVLAVLSIITAVLLPSIFNASSEKKRQSVFKETISQVQTALEMCRQDRSLNNGDFYACLKKNMSFVKTCPRYSSACGTNLTNSFSGYEAWAKILLHNGALIEGIPENPGDSWGSSSLSKVTNIIIDWNGLDGPNKLSDDQLWMQYSYGQITEPMSCNSYFTILGCGRPGSFLPFAGELPPFPNYQLYQTIFNGVN